MFSSLIAAAGVLFTTAASQAAHRCPGYENNTNIACISKYASVLPLPFDRPSLTTGTPAPRDNFINTIVPSDPSFSLLIKTSPFLVFHDAALALLGPNPSIEKLFDTRNDSIHEAPVYVPGLNVIIFSLPHQGVYHQQLINLNSTPPTRENYSSFPPVYAVNGGRYFQGRVFWAAEGGVPFPDPNSQEGEGERMVLQAPGLYSLDPWTNRTEVLLNNYFGTRFNSPNDLVVQRETGDLFFTDSWYGFGINVTGKPVLSPATYRFRRGTGLVQVVETTLGQPNGIGISPDGGTMYISDTGVTDFEGLGVPTTPRYTLDVFGGRSVYAFDLRGGRLGGKRPVWQAQTFAVDGLHVSREGFVLGAAGSGVDVLSAEGELVLRIEVEGGGVVNNFQFVGEGLAELWLFGPGGIFRVRGLEGLSGMGDE